MKKRLLTNRILSLWICGAMCLSNVTPVMAASAETKEQIELQITKTKGDVTVMDGSGREIPCATGVMPDNGDQVKTQESSYLWLGLKDGNFVKLDVGSSAESRTLGGKEEILLDAGGLYFNLQEEDMNIRTATAVLNVKNACGWVKVADRQHTLIYLLTGEGLCSVADPISGQVKSEALNSGDLAECVVYPQDHEGDKCDILLRKWAEDDVEGFVLTELAENTPLIEKISEETGIDVSEQVENAQERLQKEESELHQKLGELTEKLEKQENNVTKEPVWEGETEPEEDDVVARTEEIWDEFNLFPAPEKDVSVEEDNLLSFLNMMPSPSPAVPSPEPESGSDDEPETSPEESPAAPSNSVTNPGGTSVGENNSLVVRGVSTSEEVEGVSINLGTIRIAENGKLTVRNGFINDYVENGDTDDICGKIYNAGQMISEMDVSNRDDIITENTEQITAKQVFYNRGVVEGSGRFDAETIVKNEGDAYLEIYSGTIDELEQSSGEVYINGGTIGELNQSSGAVEIYGGSIPDYKLTGGVNIIYDGVIDIYTQDNKQGGGVGIAGGTVGVYTQNYGFAVMQGGVITNVLQEGGKIYLRKGVQAGSYDDSEMDDNEPSSITVKEGYTITGGSLTMSAGKIGVYTQGDGYALMKGGEISKVVQNGGEVYLGEGLQAESYDDSGMNDNEQNGVLVENGYTITGGFLGMSEGTLEAGELDESDAALTVNLPDNSPDENYVEISGGTIYGNVEGKAAIKAISGRLGIYSQSSSGGGGDVCALSLDEEETENDSDQFEETYYGSVVIKAKDDVLKTFEVGAECEVYYSGVLGEHHIEGEPSVYVWTKPSDVVYLGCICMNNDFPAFSGGMAGEDIITLTHDVRVEENRNIGTSYGEGSLELNGWQLAWNEERMFYIHGSYEISGGKGTMSGNIFVPNGWIEATVRDCTVDGDLLNYGKNLTVENCTITGDLSSYDSAENLIVRDCTVKGELSNSAKNLTVENCKKIGGIWNTYDCSKAVIRECNIENSLVNYGGKEITIEESDINGRVTNDDNGEMTINNSRGNVNIQIYSGRLSLNGGSYSYYDDADDDEKNSMVDVWFPDYETWVEIGGGVVLDGDDNLERVPIKLNLSGGPVNVTIGNAVITGSSKGAIIGTVYSTRGEALTLSIEEEAQIYSAANSANSGTVRLNGYGRGKAIVYLNGGIVRNDGNGAAMFFNQIDIMGGLQEIVTDLISGIAIKVVGNYPEFWNEKEPDGYELIKEDENHYKLVVKDPNGGEPTAYALKEETELPEDTELTEPETSEEQEIIDPDEEKDPSESEEPKDPDSEDKKKEDSDDKETPPGGDDVLPPDGPEDKKEEEGSSGGGTNKDDSLSSGEGKEAGESPTGGNEANLEGKTAGDKSE